MSLEGGDESTVVRGVKACAYEVPPCLDNKWFEELNTEDAVLVELADPTPFSNSFDKESCASSLPDPFVLGNDVPLTGLLCSCGRGDAGRESLRPLICGDEIPGLGLEIAVSVLMRRSCEAFDFFDCSTEGAVGKKSAKPLEARDMVDDATPNSESPAPLLVA